MSLGGRRERRGQHNIRKDAATINISLLGAVNHTKVAASIQVCATDEPSHLPNQWVGRPFNY